MKFGFRISSLIKRIAARTSGETDHPAQPGLEGPERNGLDHQSQAGHVQQGLQQNQPGLYAYTDLADGHSAFVDCHYPIFQCLLG